MNPLTESTVEAAALAWLSGQGYAVLHGPDLAVGQPGAERGDSGYRDVVLEGRLRGALGRLNPGLPAEALEEAFRKLMRLDAPTLIERNRAIHRLVVDGVTVEYRRADGSIGGAQARVVDFDSAANNDWLAVNQFTVAEGQQARRADVVVFVNGLPLAVIELKNPADENATVWSAFQQLQTYQSQIPALFNTNAVLVASDGIQARIGTLGAGREWFKPWRTISGAADAPASVSELQVVLEGVFNQRRFLDLLRYFIVFEDTGTGRIVKKMAGYHQFHAVNVALEETLRATEGSAADAVGEEPGTYLACRNPGGQAGDRRVGVVWHTQGSGKSLTMAFYAGRVILHPAMQNPTVVVITDRNDLDDQLFATFGRCRDLLRQPPDQAADREDLRKKLSVGSGGVVFATIQKFMPMAPSPQPSPSGRGSAPPGPSNQPSPSGRGSAPPGPSNQPSPCGRGSAPPGPSDQPSSSGRGSGPPGLPTSSGRGHYRGGYEFAGLVERARELRARQTPAEAILWELLRNRQVAGLKFRRQHQVGDYIADFFCDQLKLAIELDGEVHGRPERADHDARRDAWLRGMGLTVLRFPNEVALESPENILTAIAALVRDPSSRGEDPPSPSGRGAGGAGPLSLRRNIVVIADEAHRSQYDFIDGFARHMRDALPNASFVGFTGTPIEKADANTRAVFGDYISVYDIQRAVVDGATVPIYYESRLAKLELKAEERPTLDENFEEATEGEEVERKEKLKSRWAQLEAIVGSENRVKRVARDLVEHFESRLGTLDGKAMVVTMSRRIAVELYNELVALRPDWHGDADDAGALKVVMTGSASDPLDWQPHVRSKSRREALAVRFRDSKDPFRIVIVRDMWLTGFDAPCLHTMYLDKPMRGHGLMQAIARVNRVFKDKPGGLVVDYLGLADELRKALAVYTDAGGTGKTAIDQEEAVALMLEKYEVCGALFHGFNWGAWLTGTPQDRLSLLPAAQELILAQEDGKTRLLRAVTELSQAFALAVPHEEAIRIRDDVAFFQAVRAVLAKSAPGERKTDEDLDHAIRQIISRAVVSEQVVDIFEAAGLKKPDISILSDEFLNEVRLMPRRNLAVELLQKLLKGEIRSRSKRNVVQARSFAELLEKAIRKYQNRAIETAQVIEELIQLAQDLKAAAERGERLGLNHDELAFYDALADNASAVTVMGDDQLRIIARELVETVKRNVSIDWTLRENVRAQLRVLVKRILRKYGYPPDLQVKATETVLEQAEVLCDGWVG